METKQTFEQWTKTLNEQQIEYILMDFFITHPDFNPKTKKLEIVFSVVN